MCTGRVRDLENILGLLYALMSYLEREEQLLTILLNASSEVLTRLMRISRARLVIALSSGVTFKELCKFARALSTAGVDMVYMRVAGSVKLLRP